MSQGVSSEVQIQKVEFLLNNLDFSSLRHSGLTFLPFSSVFMPYTGSFFTQLLRNTLSHLK